MARPLSKMTGVLIRRGREARDQCVQRKGPPEITESIRPCRQRKRASGETRPADSLILDFQAPKFEDIHFCCSRLVVCDALYGILSKLKQPSRPAISLTTFSLIMSLQPGRIVCFKRTHRFRLGLPRQSRIIFPSQGT